MYTHHTQQGTAAAFLRLGHVLSEILEVDVLEAQQKQRQEDAAAQQEEGGHELLQGQRFARGLVLLVRPTRPREPEPCYPLEIACRGEGGDL